MERPKGAFCYYQGASFGAPSPLKVEGRKLKSQLARRRENEGAWLFEWESKAMTTDFYPAHEIIRALTCC
jgi:hypothetical protein